MYSYYLYAKFYKKIFTKRVISHTVFLPHQDTEALLFGFQSIAETIDVNYSDVIPGLIGLIPRINISNFMLADTVMYTIGRYPDTCFLLCPFISLWIYLNSALTNSFTFTIHAEFPLLARIPGWVAGWPPSDVGWDFTHGASGPCEGRAVCVQHIDSEEDLQGVQTWPRPLHPGYPDCVTGLTHSLLFIYLFLHRCNF